MNLDNRRLLEIRNEKMVYMDQLEKAESISDCITYKSRLDELKKEEKEILKKYDVII